MLQDFLFPRRPKLTRSGKRRIAFAILNADIVQCASIFVPLGMCVDAEERSRDLFCHVDVAPGETG